MGQRQNISARLVVIKLFYTVLPVNFKNDKELTQNHPKTSMQTDIYAVIF